MWDYLFLGRASHRLHKNDTKNLRIIKKTSQNPIGKLAVCYWRRLHGVVAPTAYKKLSAVSSFSYVGIEHPPATLILHVGVLKPD
jgi:hypothetical protein